MPEVSTRRKLVRKQRHLLHGLETIHLCLASYVARLEMYECASHVWKCMVSISNYDNILMVASDNAEKAM